jgi:hypothetical protein
VLQAVSLLSFLNPYVRTRCNLPLRILDLFLDLTMVAWLVLGNYLVFSFMEETKETTEIRYVVYFLVGLGYLDFLRWALILIFTVLVIGCLCLDKYPKWILETVGPLVRRNRRYVA